MQKRLRPIGFVVAALAGCALLFWLALQRPASLGLDIGGELRPRPGNPQVRDVYVYDAPYLEDMHAPEPATIEISTTATYRWTRPTSLLRAPALGGATLVAHLLVAPPPVPTTPLTITINGARAHATLPPEQRLLTLFAPTQGTGNVEIKLDAPLFQTLGDPRELGLTLFGVWLRPAGWRAVASWGVWGALLALCLGLAVSARLSMFGWGATTLVVLLGGLILTMALLIDRAAVALGAGRWMLAVLGGTAGLALWRLVSRWLTLEPELRREAAWVAGLTMLAWMIRVAGIRHPQANFSDLLLNTNNQTVVFQGQLFFSEGLPAEAGGGAAPYPPLLYLVLMPLYGLFRDPAGRGTVMQIGTALLDALTVPLLWWGVRQLRPDAVGRRIALWAAALYLVPLPVLRSLIVGEFANVGAQALAMPAVIGMVVWAAHDCPRRWRTPLIGALLVAMLGHNGVLISLTLTGVLWGAGLLATRRWRVLGQLALVTVVAGVLAVGLYYSAFLLDPLPPAPGVPPELQFGLGRKIWIFVQAQVLRFDADTPIWLWALALAGAALVPRRLPGWKLPLYAWLATAPASFVTLLWSAQTVRWWTWVYPALCVAAGVALQRLTEWRWRGWSLGRRLAPMAYVGTLALALGLWIAFIVEYRTGAFVP